MRTAGYLAQAAKNALAVGAFEEVLRLIDDALMLLPADKHRARAQALTMRGQAFWGLGRLDEAQAAMKGAAQRYEELGDAKSLSAIDDRLQTMKAKEEEPQPVVEPDEAATELDLVGAQKADGAGSSGD